MPQVTSFKIPTRPLPFLRKISFQYVYFNIHENKGFFKFFFFIFTILYGNGGQDSSTFNKVYENMIGEKRNKNTTIKQHIRRERNFGLMCECFGLMCEWFGLIHTWVRRHSFLRKICALKIKWIIISPRIWNNSSVWHSGRVAVCSPKGCEIASQWCCSLLKYSSSVEVFLPPPGFDPGPSMKQA